MSRRRVTCGYCGRPARLVPNAEIYGRDYGGGRAWRCAPCDAHVGCHPGTSRPLGTLANAGLRQLRKAAHAAFDPLWMAKQVRDKMTKGGAREAGYAWLARRMNLSKDECHIGLFDEARCRLVIAICEPYLTAASRSGTF